MVGIRDLHPNSFSTSCIKEIRDVKMVLVPEQTLVLIGID
jgi:hypothetical protein